MTRILKYLAPWPKAGSTVVQKHTSIREISEISVKKTTFLCKTNPILSAVADSKPFCNKALRKIYIFVESQKQTQFKPNQSQFFGLSNQIFTQTKPIQSQTWAIWAIWAGLLTGEVLRGFAPQVRSICRVVYGCSSSR
jgi:hypothetical protein